MGENNKSKGESKASIKTHFSSVLIFHWQRNYLLRIILIFVSTDAKLDQVTNTRW